MHSQKVAISSTKQFVCFTIDFDHNNDPPKKKKKKVKKLIKRFACTLGVHYKANQEIHLKSDSAPRQVLAKIGRSMIIVDLRQVLSKDRQIDKS
jgi:hypothetical protein